jgi:signal transduction histidine kinase
MSIETDEALLEADALVAHLQESEEAEKAAVARALHDDLGGLMVAAVMDLDAVRRQEPGLSLTAIARLERLRRTIEEAIDIKRRVIEKLRPSILDNFGLFAALRWQNKTTWENSPIVATETYPEEEPVFEPKASMSLFRIAQQALAMTLSRTSVKSADLKVKVDARGFWMHFTDDGLPDLSAANMAAERTALASMQYRIRAHGGKVETSRNATGGMVLTAWMPLPE